MNRLWTVIPILVIAAFVPQSSTAQTSGFWAVVQVDGFRNQNGLAAIAVYDNPEGFPENPARAVGVAFVPIRGGHAELRVWLPGPNTYAAAAYHDENANQRLDRNEFMGIPTTPAEGWAVSGGARPCCGPPSFAESAFYAGGEGSITLWIGY